VTNVRKAWATFQQDPVSLVISDWMMPDSTASSCVVESAPRTVAKYTYIILLTALEGKESYLEAMEAGADDFGPSRSTRISSTLGCAWRSGSRPAAGARAARAEPAADRAAGRLGPREMASGIAHDFSNALSSVVGFSSLLLEHPAELDDRERRSCSG